MLRTESGEAVYVEVHAHVGEHGDVGDHEDVVVGRAEECVVVVADGVQHNGGGGRDVRGD